MPQFIMCFVGMQDEPKHKFSSGLNLHYLVIFIHLHFLYSVKRTDFCGNSHFAFSYLLYRTGAPTKAFTDLKGFHFVDEIQSEAHSRKCNVGIIGRMHLWINTK